MVGFNAVLAPTIARPPTPPKESTAQMPDESKNTFMTNATYRPLLDTPEESPSSSAECFKGSSGKLHKKVLFSPFTDYHPMNGHDSDSDRKRKRAPPPKDLNPAKSILKACIDNVISPSIEGLLTPDQDSLPIMLRSTTQHLASSSRASRLDAYSTLLACLSAYDNIPETQDLVEKVVEITGYIRRDITTKIGEGGTVDVQLATQALKILTVFVFTPPLATVIPEDFSLYFLERCISSIEDSASPKILVTHYMHILEKQKISSRQLSPDRVNRLLTALDGVTSRTKGNRIVGHRLMIYQRLLTQAKPVMVLRVGNWIDHLMSGMLSSIKDIRSRAIAFGVDAGLHFGTTSSVSQACIELFNRTSADGKKFVNVMSSRLTEMTDSKEESVHVPQIWSVVVLLLRSRRRQLECWEHIKVWLQVIQRCFNSSDGQVKFQANIAWNRLIFAINLDTSTSNSMAKMLRQPIMSSLERKAIDKSFRQAKSIARSSYCTLLYYAFRPMATHVQLDLYWDLYVSQILPSSFVASKTEINYACEVLAALFTGNGKPKIWDENRANVVGEIKPEELPCLDPKWIRLRAANVLQTFDKFLDLAEWQLDNKQESPVLVAWRSFASALGIACSKEVKTSMETTNAVAQILNQVKRILDRSDLKHVKNRAGQEQVARDTANQPDDIEKIRFIVHEAVAKIGNIPFTERRVILTSQDSFAASATPSSRSDRDKDSRYSPMTHLLNHLLSHKMVPGIDNSASYRNVLQEVLHINLQSATSRRARVGILRNQARLLTVDSATNKAAKVVFWQLIAEAASLAMDLGPQSETHNDSPQYPGHEYREVVKILELGLQLRSKDTSLVWQQLHDRVVKSLREEIGDNGVTLVMTEHLADVVRKDAQLCDDLLLGSATSILDAMHWPQSVHLMERAQKLLWGAVHISHKGNFVDTFDNLYSMVDAVLISLYEGLANSSTPNVVSFLSATSNIIDSCPSTFQCTALYRMQSGLGHWIEDPQGVLSNSASSSTNLVPTGVRKLSSVVLSAINSFTKFDSKVLLQYQSLMSSCLKSRHKSVLNDSLAMWNRTFGTVDSLEYPEDLRPILSKWKSITDIQLPSFAEVEGDEAMSSPFHFVESQEDEENIERAPAAILPERSPMQDPSQIGARSIVSAVLSPNRLITAATRESPYSAQRRVKTTPKARLRHDDSQIQFAAVESSPLALEPLESHYLTDRQKEVKERQTREAAAMFPDIRSSPRSTSRTREYSLPKLVFNPKQNEPSKSSADDDISPVFPPDVLMNDFLGSSPTPGSSKKCGNNQQSDDGPPSSPPFISSHLNVFDKMGPCLSHEDHSVALEENINHNLAGVEKQDLPIKDGVPNEIEDEQVDRQPHKTANHPERVRIRSDEGIMSDLSVYVDAPSEPTIPPLAVDQAEKELSHVTNSFQSQESSRYGTEDDQVTAQLVSEMERASSQQSQLLQAITKPAQKSSKPSRKRKGVFDFPPSANKKAKRNSASSSPQLIAETPRAGEMIADCVMIDVHRVPSNRAVSPVQIKREGSPPPSVITASQFAEETSASKRGRGRPKKQTRASQLSTEDSSVRKTSRQRRIKKEQDEGVAMTSTFPTKTTRNSKGSRKSIPGSQQQNNSASSQDHNSELDTDPLAPNADNNIVQDRMEGMNTHRSPQARPTPHVLSRSKSQEASSTNGHTKQHPPEVGTLAETQEHTPTPQRILQKLKDALESIKRAALGREEERSVVDVLVESIKEAHEAGRRNPDT